MSNTKFTAFWAVNGDLEIQKLTAQLKEMKEYGFDGVIFHPRFYTDCPPFMGKDYLQILSETILCAKRLGLEFWIYDENGWPSGSGNGKVLEQFPDSTCQWLEYENQTVILKEKRSFNTFCREQMSCFIRIIYDGYRLGLSPEAFSYVKGFFSDETGFLDGHGAASSGGVPWCPEASKRFESQYHTPLSAVWDNLFTESGNYREIRSLYWQILSDILADSFYGPINEWCHKYGKRYTAHLKGEENLFFQIPYSGSAFWNLKNVDMPAVDALERYPGNHYYPRIASSLSRQFGDGECLAEAFGGSGWGLSPADFEHYIDWLCECGINHFTLHLWQYDKNAASIRDWPPNIPVGLNWKDCFFDLINTCKAKWAQSGYKPNHTVVIAPMRAVMSHFNPADALLVNEHNGDGVPPCRAGEISSRFASFIEQLYRDGVSFDVTEERIAEEFGTVNNGRLQIGNAVYDNVIASSDCCWSGTFIDTLESSGILQLDTDVDWRFVQTALNTYCLEEKSGSVPFCLSNISGQWFLTFSDKPDCIKVMGRRLEPVLKEGSWTAELPSEILSEAKEHKELSWEIDSAGSPFVFLRGPFLVRNRIAYQKARSADQVMTTGSFYLADYPENQEECLLINPHDLITSGFPFAQEPVVLERTVTVSGDGLLHFEDISADCISVTVDGCNKGFLWGAHTTIGKIAPGRHLVRIALYPSTFNVYGPRSHMDGDRHLTSPFQYSGEKSFADYADATRCTLSDWKHFRKFGI